MKSFLNTGIFTAFLTCSRFSILPWKKLGSVSTEMATAPAFSIAIAICAASFGVISLLWVVGDAGLTSAITGIWFFSFANRIDIGRLLAFIV